MEYLFWYVNVNSKKSFIIQTLPRNNKKVNLLLLCECNCYWFETVLNFKDYMTNIWCKCNLEYYILIVYISCIDHLKCFKTQKQIDKLSTFSLSD